MFFSGLRLRRGRRDGRLVKELPALRRVMPHVMPTRLDATIYYPQDLDVDTLVGWLEEVNADRAPEDRLKFFHVFLAALARLYRARPELNRFISGRRTWEHRDISFAFTVKRSLTDEAPEEQARITFTGTETLDDVRRRVDSVLDGARNGDGGNRSEQLIDAVVRLPGPVLAALAQVVWGLDRVNLLPGFLQDAIPFHSSAYVVNLGSLGAEAPFHHLYRRGTASVFMSIGTIRPEPVIDGDGAVVARRRVRIVYTVDERVTDGFYLVHSAHLLQEMFDDPPRLLLPPTD